MTLRAAVGFDPRSRGTGHQPIHHWRHCPMDVSIRVHAEQGISPLFSGSRTTTQVSIRVHAEQGISLHRFGHTELISFRSAFTRNRASAHARSSPAMIVQDTFRSAFTRNRASARSPRTMPRSASFRSAFTRNRASARSASREGLVLGFDPRSRGTGHQPPPSATPCQQGGSDASFPRTCCLKACLAIDFRGCVENAR